MRRSRSLPPVLCISLRLSDSSTRLHFVLSSSPLMTDLCWGRGSKLSRGSAVRHSSRTLRTNRPPRRASAPSALWLRPEENHQLQAGESENHISEEISEPSTARKAWLKGACQRNKDGAALCGCCFTPKLSALVRERCNLSLHFSSKCSPQSHQNDENN